MFALASLMNPFGKVAPFFAIFAEYSSFAVSAEVALASVFGFSSCPCGPPPASGLDSAFLASAGFSAFGAGVSLIQVPNFLASG